MLTGNQKIIRRYGTNQLRGPKEGGSANVSLLVLYLRELRIDNDDILGVLSLDSRMIRTSVFEIKKMKLVELGIAAFCDSSNVLVMKERESKLYDEFDMFTSVPGEIIHSYYLSKFVTDVKLAKDLNNINFDQLYAYLRQHEAHADEVRIMKERFPNPLTLVANTYNSSPSYSNQTQYHQQLSPFASPQQVSPLASQQLVHHQSYQAPDVHQPSQASFPLMDPRLVVPPFLPSDDLIASLNKEMAFISTAFTS
ncbi:hypothetical protein Tco_1055429 [Tanacetum coccineum]|uniref:Uncharacterized protein n=1 Tax=Tanacetum coccineum TaxID=301880 RepID=A0ABQ5H1G7_9ASTR